MDFLLRFELKATLEDPQGMTEDPRVMDLQSGKGRVSLKVKFRRALSQRSLALEYSQWESRTHGSSRVTELADYASMSRRGGHIPDFLKRNTHRFKDKKLIRGGIEYGKL